SSGVGVFPFADGAIRGSALDVGQQVIGLPFVSDVIFDDPASRFLIALPHRLLGGLVIDVLANFRRRFSSQREQLLSRLFVQIPSVFGVELLLRGNVCGFVKLADLGADGGGARWKKLFDVSEVGWNLRYQVVRLVGPFLVEYAVSRDLERGGCDHL